MNKIYKIEFYIPQTHVEAVKQAIFATGAGQIGNYDCCAWQTTAGTGQFRPRPGSRPFIGSLDKVEYVEEVKVELVCDEKYIDAAITALHASHPYETPALQYWKVKT
jgi:structural toxin protein (hemagglutinin/hemolysin) RtxA